MLIVIQDRQNELGALLKWQWNPLEDKPEGIIQINSQGKTKQNKTPPKTHEKNIMVRCEAGDFWTTLSLSTKGANNAQLGRQV